MPALVTTLTCTPRYEPYSADVLPVCTWTSVTASAIGRMLVIASRLELALMPSIVRLFWISRWPAPRKDRPMSVVLPRSTPGVVAASCHTLRPLDGRSTTARASTVCDTAARSVWSVVLAASTMTVSDSAPTLNTASWRTTWLPPTSMLVALNVWKPWSVMVIS